MPSPCMHSVRSRLEYWTDCRCSKLVDGIVYEVDCQLITVKAGADVDIGK